MKRIIALALALVVLMTALVSCGKKGGEKLDLSTVKTLADLNGSNLKIAAQTATFHLDALESQVTGIKVEEMADFSVMLTALLAKTVDGYVAEEPTAWAVCEENEGLAYIPFLNNETGFTAAASDAGVAIAFKTGSDYVAKVNAILATVNNETRANLMKQMSAVSADPDAEQNLPAVLTIPAVASPNGTLKIAMECDYKPYNWTQTTAANGAVAIANNAGMYANGYDVQFARFVAASLGMNLEVYAYDWNSLIPAVQAGTVDGIIAGMSPTEEREIEVDFTDCYWTSHLVIIYNKK